MTDNKILFAIEGDTCYVRMQGSLTYTICAGFDGVVKELFSNEDIHNFIIDLTDAEYLDSTNLGILGIIAEGLKSKSNKKPLIISPKEDVLKILLSVAFDTLFDFQDHIEKHDINYMDTASTEVKKRSADEFVLESHKTLAQMNEDNKEKFSHVVETIQNRKLQKK
jgi:anti-anti-sigma factor